MEFLSKVAAELIKNRNYPLHQCYVVLPNRRAGVFLKTEIARLLNSPMLLPKIVTIQEFITELSGLTLVDDFHQLFILYKSYTEIANEKADSFDEFLGWGQKLLHDLDEIDQHLANAEYIFNYLKEEKNLALWALDKSPLSDFQKNYLQFFSSLYPIYHKFTEKLYSEKLGNYGMACKEAVKKLSDPNLRLPFQTAYFCGFNAFTTGESRIGNVLKQRAQADFFWDADEYYLNELNQEAGYFLRKNLEDFKKDEIKWVSKALSTNTKEIHILGVSGNIGQVKALADELQHNHSNDTSGLTAVVLNDENLLIPFLNSIPDKIDSFNVTMGFPMKFAPIYAWLVQWFQLHLNATKFGEIRKRDEALFYKADLLKFIGNSCFQVYISNNTALAKEFLSSKQFFFTYAELSHLLKKNQIANDELLENIFKPLQNDVDNAISRLLFLIEKFREGKKSNNPLDNEFLFALHNGLNQLLQLCKSSGIRMQTATLLTLFRQILSMQKVPFVGEPLKGLQIMGLLETRLLDFKRVYMLSVNEDIIPKSKNPNTFIPHGIRKDAGLPVFTMQEQIFPYHFYRLLQQAETIYLYYNTNPDVFGSGEKSRFISQLQFELPKKNPNVKIFEHQILVPLKIENSEDIIIAKNESILKKVNELAQSGFSPSSLNCFRRCSLQYYFKYIAGIKEKEEAHEILDNRDIGNYLHLILERLFEKNLNEPLTENLLEELKNKAISIVDDVMQDEMQQYAKSHTGKNFLIYHVLREYFVSYIQTLQQRIDEAKAEGKVVTVLGLEVPLEKEFLLNINQNEIQIKIKGKADRIDSIGEDILILDYKSGGVNGKTFEINQLAANDPDPGNDYCFQLLIYLWLYAKNNDVENKKLGAGIWSFRNLDNPLHEIFLKDNDGNKIFSLSSDDLKIAEDLLAEIISNLFDSSKNFEPTTEPKNCEYCAYAALCGK